MGFEHFDTVMSFAVVMLLLSMIVMVGVQAMAALLGLRGRNLFVGVTTLVEQIDPTLRDHASTIAEAILTHATLSHTWNRKATAIRPDELVKIARDLASDGRQGLAAGPKAALNRVLENANHFEMQVSEWFDTVMDRTSERFTLHTRWLTALLAVLVALSLRIDTLDVFHQLSTNPELRAKVSQLADTTATQAQHLIDDGSVKGQRLDEAATARLSELSASLASTKDALQGTGLKLIFNSVPFQPKDARTWVPIGVLMTCLFLSMGAPFWFNTLSQLANLRPALATKVEQDGAKK
jgi:hypothetical protein